MSSTKSKSRTKCHAVWPLHTHPTPVTSERPDGGEVSTHSSTKAHGVPTVTAWSPSPKKDKSTSITKIASVKSNIFVCLFVLRKRFWDTWLTSGCAQKSHLAGLRETICDAKDQTGFSPMLASLSNLHFLKMFCVLLEVFKHRDHRDTTASRISCLASRQSRFDSPHNTLSTSLTRNKLLGVSSLGWDSKTNFQDMYLGAVLIVLWVECFPCIWLIWVQFT